MTAPSWPQVRAAMRAAFAPITMAQGSDGRVQAPAGRYVRLVDDYYGQFEDDELIQEVAGRCPAMLVAFAGEQAEKRYLDGRRASVRATFVVWCCSDRATHKRTRGQEVERMAADARRLVAGSRLGLDLEKPFQYVDVRVANILRDASVAAFTVLGVALAASAIVDVTQEGPFDALSALELQIPLVGRGRPEAPGRPVLVVGGADEGCAYGYQVVGELASGELSPPSPLAWTDRAQAQLGVPSSATVAGTFLPTPGAVRHHVYRVITEGTGASATKGRIATVEMPAVEFADIGNVGDGTRPEAPAGVARRLTP
jgi:phage gp37-like protein